MSGKSTALLLAAAAFLFAFVCLIERPLRQASLIPPDQRVLPNLDPAGITAVEVLPVGRGIIRAAQTNHDWQLTQPISYPADAARVGQLLEKLAHWEWRTSIGSDELTNHPDAEAEFGFVPPQYTVALEEGARERTLEVGHLSALGNEVYLKMRGGYRIYVADADVLKWLPTEKDQWRDRAVVDLNHTACQKIVITNASFDGPISFDFDSAEHLWNMTSPVDARADTAKITGLLAQLQALRVQAFAPDDSQGLDVTGLSGPGKTPPLKLAFFGDTMGTNTTFSLEVGTPPTNATNLVFARRQSPANLIEIPRNPLVPWEESYTNFLDPHLTSLSATLITSIHGIGGDEFTVQKSAEGGWVVHEHDESFPADEGLMKIWFDALTNMAVAVEQMTVANVAMYGLDTPFLRYQLHYAVEGTPGQSLTNELLFGLSTNSADKIYERFEGYKSVNAVTRDQFNQLPRFGWQLRDRSIFHFESNEVAAIAVHQQGADRRFIRDVKNQWMLSSDSSGSTTPETPYGVNETLYRMGRTNAVYWDGVGEDNLEWFGFRETDYWIAFEIKRGGQMETNTIHFGKRSPYWNPYAYVVRDGRKLIFEFPVKFFEDWVANYLSIPAAYRPPR